LRLLRKLLLFLILVNVIGLSGAAVLCAAKNSPPAEQKFEAIKIRYNSFMADSEQWSKRTRWESLIREFDDLARYYPHSKRADDSLYLSGGLYFSLYNYSGWSSDLQQAAKRYKMLLDNYGESRLADDAMFYLGNIAFKLKDEKQAQTWWRRLLSDFPDTDMRQRAVAALEKLETSAQPSSAKQPSRKDPRVTKAQSRKKPSQQSTTVKVEARFNNSAPVVGLARVIDLRHWSSPTYTRVVLDLDREIQFSKGILKDKGNQKKTKSIYLNLADSMIPEVSREVPINDGILQSVKVAQFNANTVRAVIHVAEIDHYKIFALNNPPRIVIDVIGGEYFNARQKRGQSPAATFTAAANNNLSLAQQLGLGVGTIVLDAGHGGRDPGAISSCGLKEKDIVLDITKRVRDELQKRLQCHVYLTRENDVYLPLEERTVIANTRKADLFISIHANASRNRSAHGVETYFLNLSTDNEAMELAALENATSTKNVGHLQSILNDLMQNSKIKESSRLAGCIQASLVGNLSRSYQPINNLGVKQAPFYVLIGAQMPSVLVEVSFISNAMEAQRLQSSTYRQRIAEGLVDGVEKYINEIKVAGHRIVN